MPMKSRNQPRTVAYAQNSIILFGTENDKQTFEYTASSLEEVELGRTVGLYSGQNFNNTAVTRHLHF